MPNPTVTSRTAGRTARTATPRHVAAAARAAAKRAERAARTGEPADEPAEEPAEELPQAPAPEPEAEPEAGPGGRRRRVLTAVLALLVVAGLVTAGVLGSQYVDGRRTEQARAQAPAAARKAAPVVLSYDYRHLDQDFTRARGYLTGAFLDQYRKTTSTVVAPTAAKYHGVVKATVAGGQASVVSASPNRVVVLLFVNQVTQSTQVTGSRLDLNRVRMTLTRTSDGWKVSAVDAL